MEYPIIKSQKTLQVQNGHMSNGQILNYISCQYAYKPIKQDNPTAKMKRKILSYFHGNLRATAKKILIHIDRLRAFNNIL